MANWTTQDFKKIAFYEYQLSLGSVHPEDRPYIDTKHEVKFVKRKLLPLLVFILTAAASGQEPRPTTLKDLNFDFMLRGYFYAGSRIADKNALGGFGPSENFPRPSKRVLTCPPTAFHSSPYQTMKPSSPGNSGE